MFVWCFGGVIWLITANMEHGKFGIHFSTTSEVHYEKYTANLTSVKCRTNIGRNPALLHLQSAQSARKIPTVLGMMFLKRPTCPSSPPYYQIRHWGKLCGWSLAVGLMGWLQLQTPSQQPYRPLPPLAWDQRGGKRRQSSRLLRQWIVRQSPSVVFGSRQCHCCWCANLSHCGTMTMVSTSTTTSTHRQSARRILREDQSTAAWCGQEIIPPWQDSLLNSFHSRRCWCSFLPCHFY